MDVILEKQKIRKKFQKLRSSLSQEEVEKKSDLITRNFIENLLPKLIKNKTDITFGIYLSSNNEVKTNSLIEYFKNKNINFAYPKIIKEKQPLEFILYEPNQKLIPNSKYKTILEPNSGKKIIPDFIITPLVIFDNSQTRLGMGGGFFDRTIQSLKIQKPIIKTIGLAYSLQHYKQRLPHEETDEKLDFIITESNILFKKAIVRWCDSIKKN